MPIDRSEHRPLRDTGDVEPARDGGDRTPPGSPKRYADLAPCTLLVRLRLSERDNDALADLLDVGRVEPDEFGSAKAASKPEKQQRAIPHVADAGAGRIEDGEEVVP